MVKGTMWCNIVQTMRVEGDVKKTVIGVKYIPEQI